MSDFYQDEFGGRKKRKRRRAKRKTKRKERRASGRGLAKLKKIKKVAKPLKKIVTSKVFKKILSYVPGYGPAAVSAIEAGQAIAKKAKGKVKKVADIERKVVSASVRGDVKAVAALKKKGEKAAESARKEIERVGRVSVARKRLVRSAVAKAKAGDARAATEIKRLQVSPSARRSLDRAAERLAVKSSPSVSSSPVKAPPGKVVVMIEGRRFTFDRSAVRGR